MKGEGPLKKYKRESKEYLEGWQRTQAEFQNYIKQKDKEMQEFRKFAADDIVLKIIPVLDNLILASMSMPENLKSNQWAKGMAHIQKQFEDVMRENGVAEISANPGDKFDPAYHESYEEIKSDTESGAIAGVVQVGYTLHGKVIRPARVKVAK